MRIPQLLLLLAASCGQATPGPLEAPPFHAERAWEDLRHLVEKIGPRRIGTPQAEATRAYIRSALEPLGWTFEEEPFTVTPPEGATRKGELRGVNLYARRPGTEPGEIWLASHYDTFDLPGFVGANDAGSSTAVLIELGRALAGRDPRPGSALVLAWFDGEERFYDVPWDDQTNGIFGSRHAVARLKETGRIGAVRALVLLDMIGDKSLGLLRESESTPWLRAVFEVTANRLGWPQLFVQSMPIKDDHLPFARASVPAVDLIDFHYGPENRYWHTREDTLDKLSADSLRTIGQLVLAALPEIEQRAPAAR